MSKYLNKEDIVKIPALLKKGLNTEEVAKELKTTPSTINRWKKRLKEAGYEVPNKMGRPIIDLKK